MSRKDVNIESPRGTSLFVWCLAVICTVITVAVIIGGGVVFIGYQAIKPKVPYVRVSYAHLDVFNLDQSGILTTQLTIVITAENNNTKALASFSDLRYTLSFNSKSVAELKSHPFNVGQRGSLPLTFPVVSTPIPLDPKQTSFASSSIQNNFIPFDLTGHARSRWRVGFMSSPRFFCGLTCQLRFGRDGNIINSACTATSI